MGASWPFRQYLVPRLVRPLLDLDRCIDCCWRLVQSTVLSDLIEGVISNMCVRSKVDRARGAAACRRTRMVYDGDVVALSTQSGVP